jgi:hypothetical protein
MFDHFVFAVSDYAQTRQQVDAFHRAALEAGGRDNGAPACVRNTTPTTMPRSSRARTDTTSKRCAMSPWLDRQPEAVTLPGEIASTAHGLRNGG